MIYIKLLVSFLPISSNILKYIFYLFNIYLFIFKGKATNKLEVESGTVTV